MDTALKESRLPDPSEDSVKISFERVRLEVADIIRKSENQLIEQAFPGHIVICADNVMKKSEGSYPLPWIMRETLVQNFVDENLEHPGTLDGVEIDIEELDNGRSRIAVTGNWPFRSCTGLVSFFSGKSEDQGKAGGNGFGVKQSALLLKRSHDVHHFSIFGEGWEVVYKLLSKDEINSKLDGEHQVSTGWLVAEIKASSNTGFCTYLIETTNQEIVRQASEIHNMGVSQKNKYLKDPDYVHEAGVLKWLPFEETGDDSSKLQEGRFFMNGQVMSYGGEKPSENNSGWPGPRGFNLQFNEVDYQMSLDRAPTSLWDLLRYGLRLINSMGKEDLVQQMEQSRHIWSSQSTAKYEEDDKKASLNLIEWIVNKLKRFFDKDDYLELFGDASYVCLDSSISKEQAKQLRECGHLFCPDFFSSLGVPTARSFLDDIEAASANKPNEWLVGEAIEKTASEGGIPVAFRGPSCESNPRELAIYLADELFGSCQNIRVRNGKDNTLRIYPMAKITKEHLLKQMPPVPKKDYVDDLLYIVRGVAHAGLNNGVFKDFFIAQGEYVNTFLVKWSNDELLSKLVEAHSKDVFFEITFPSRDDMQLFYDTLQTPGLKQAIQKRLEQEEEERRATELRLLRLKIRDLEEKLAASTLPSEENSDDINTASSGLFSRFFGKRKKLQKQASAITGNSVDLESIPRVSFGRESVAEITSLDCVSSRCLGVESASSKPEFREPPPIIEDFEPLENPTQSQLDQLSVVMKYLHLTTGYLTPNDVFIFRGKGASGINIDGDIGLHEEVLRASFGDAVSVLVHEVVHNSVPNHGVRFHNLCEAINAEIHDVLVEIARTDKQQRTKTQNRILDFGLKWDQLRNG
jgi:hypothetical protein